MKKPLPACLISALLFSIIFHSCSYDSSRRVNDMVISDGWEFRAADSSDWMSALVPGCVHTDLLRNDVIADPFYRLNEHDVQWVDKNDWVYRTTFSVSASMLKNENMELHFPGLDTYADVRLNDTLILQADNMFRHWSADCKSYLKKGKNTLEIYFHSPIKKGIEKHDALSYSIPTSGNDLAEIGQVEGNKKVSIFTRKPGYHFGWDWGPRLVTSGIWKPVVLKTWNDAVIRDMQVVQHALTEESAEMEVVAELEYTGFESGLLILNVNRKRVAERQLDARNISHLVKIPFTIESPEIWWPNGAGEQPLYEIELLLIKKGIVQHRKTVRTGLRTIELERTPDEIGASFKFIVNGRPMFMKGANYIPQDVFLDRVSPAEYEQVIQSAVDANMNMLRVWGGGIYEKDIFYDLCDEKGLLVWQDFMFACNMYPVDEAFMKNVRLEAIDNIKRLRNHPCIALWCGNNENLSAWFRWGWKDRVTREQGKSIADLLWKGYEDVFHTILPEMVEQYDSDRYYWSSSPSKEMGVPEELTHGDVHYWGVWWGKEPFETFREHTGRFMSEYGFQSFPEMRTIEEYASPEDYDIDSEVMKSHQRSSIGNQTITLYMDRDFRKPKDFKSFIYVGQVLQGEGIKKAIQLHRSRMPVCMGSLYWQINDCWPVASWSGIDYYGRWKAMHYKVRDAFKNVILAPDLIGNSVEIRTISDLPEELDGQLVMQLLTMTGEVVWEQSSDIVIPAGRSEMAYKTDLATLLSAYRGPGEAESQLVLDIMLTTQEQPASGLTLGNPLDQQQLYFSKPKDLALGEPAISLKQDENGERIRITLQSDILAKNVYLTCSNCEGFFSNNYFDMLPGREYIVEFESLEEPAVVPQFEIVSLKDSFAEISQ